MPFQSRFSANIYRIIVQLVETTEGLGNFQRHWRQTQGCRCEGLVGGDGILSWKLFWSAVSCHLSPVTQLCFPVSHTSGTWPHLASHSHADGGEDESDKIPHVSLVSLSRRQEKPIPVPSCDSHTPERTPGVFTFRVPLSS